MVESIQTSLSSRTTISKPILALLKYELYAKRDRFRQALDLLRSYLIALKLRISILYRFLASNFIIVKMVTATVNLILATV